MNILLINDTSDWCHWGCTGTSTILKERIKIHGHNLDTLPARETYKGAWENRPNTLDQFKDNEIYQKFCQKNPMLVNKINSADAIIINGEGTIHGLKDPPLNILYLAYISKIFFNKHVEIINHSVFPEDNLIIENNQTKLFYQEIYKILDYVAVRERLSLNILKELGVPATLSFDCLPIYIKEHYQKKIETRSKNLVVAGSASFNNSNLDSIVKYINWMDKNGFEINLLIGANNFKSSDSQMVNFLDDEKIVNFFKQNFSHINWHLIDAKSMNEWLNAIAEAELLVSGRFHHSIAAACLGTQFIALNSNTPKLDGLMQILERTPVFQYNDQDLFTKLVSRTEEILAGAFSNKSESIINKLCELAENNFNGLKELSP